MRLFKSPSVEMNQNAIPWRYTQTKLKLEKEKEKEMEKEKETEKETEKEKEKEKLVRRFSVSSGQPLPSRHNPDT